MNLLGKILTVLILVLSIGFMFASFFVYASHRNWKDEAQRISSDLSAAQQENRELDAKIQQEKIKLASERAARASALAVLEQRAQKAEQERMEAARTLQQLQQSQRQAVQALTGSQETLANLKAEVDRLRADVKKAESDRDEMFQQVVALKVKELEAEGVRRRLESQNRAAINELSKATAVLRANGLSADSPLTKVPPPLDGQVVSVDNDNGYVRVSIGDDEGLQKNHTLEVFRRGQYLAKVRVIKTYSDESVAKVMDGFRKGAIRVGDSVATKIKVR
jgi:DNA repair exonuclease SbcCD ATPase subunit